METLLTPTTPEVPSPVVIKKSKLLFILLSVLIVLLIGTGTFFIGKSLKKPTLAPKPPIESQITSIPTPTPDETANWKTYTNKKYGFSFKYPTSRTIDRIETDKVSLRLLVQISNITPVGIGDHFIIMVSPKSYDNLNSEMLGTINQYNGSVSEVQITTDIVAKRYIFITGIGGTEYVTHTIFAHGSDVFDIEATVTNPLDNEEKKSLSELDQILSTLKFLNLTDNQQGTNILKANLVDTTGWQMINAKTYSILIPPEYSSSVNADSINLRHKIKPENVAVFGIDRVGDQERSRPGQVYTGGSRREWWINSSYDQDHPAPPNLRFQEKLLGKISCLEVFENPGFSAILISNKDKLYQLSGTIDWSIIETIGSTIIFK